MMSKYRLREALQLGCSEVRAQVKARQDSYEEALIKARKSGDEPPRAHLPSAASNYWLKWAADELAVQELPKWVRDEDLVEAGEDLVGPVALRLLELPELKRLQGVEIETRWTPAVVMRKDLTSDEPKVGRIKVVPKADRLAWPVEGSAPEFRLELSLPYVLLATEEELERGLHELLVSCGFNEQDDPVLRKPDIATFSSTLGRYGVSTSREAQAIAYAQACPDLSSQLLRFGYDPETGQGVLFDAPKPKEKAAQDEKPRVAPMPDAEA